MAISGLAPDEGLCRFNGTDFNTDVQQDSLAREVAGTSFKDHTGALWFGYQSGNIARYTGSHFETINTGIELKRFDHRFCRT